VSGWFQKKPEEPDWSLISGINFRKAGWVAVVLAVIGVAGWQGYQFYLVWHEQKLVMQAWQFARDADIRSGVLNARQVLASNPTNLAATRLMAELADQAKMPAAIRWRERVDELEPHRLQNQLAWAATALRVGELGVVKQVLEKVDAAGQQTAEYQQLAAAWAVQAKQFGLAERYFSGVLRLQPTNELARLNLATVRLQLPRPESRAEGVAALEQLRLNPKFQLAAVRALLAEAKRQKQPDRELALARELKESPRADYRDQLPYLDVLQQSRHPEFSAQLAEYQTRAEAQPQNIFLLIEWMNARGMAAQALEWRDRMTPELRARRPIPIAVAESCRQLTNWVALKALVAEANWMDMDYVRLANLALALDERNESRESRSQWQRAVAATRDNPRQVALLARLAEGWGWSIQAEELWWQLANERTGNYAALQALYRLNKIKRDTRQLLRVSNRIYQLNRSDLVAKNNLALFSLLLHVELFPSAHQLARENYQTSTNTLAFVTTYAFSLHEQKRTADGLKLLNPLTDEQLQDPAVSAYYGLLLAANQEGDKARKYLDRADGAPQLLPEEQLLVREARRKLP
jgi:hypothetical protein